MNCSYSKTNEPNKLWCVRSGIGSDGRRSSCPHGRRCPARQERLVLELCSSLNFVDSGKTLPPRSDPSSNRDEELQTSKLPRFQSTVGVNSFKKTCSFFQIFQIFKITEARQTTRENGQTAMGQTPSFCRPGPGCLNLRAFRLSLSTVVRGSRSGLSRRLTQALPSSLTQKKRGAGRPLTARSLAPVVR